MKPFRGAGNLAPPPVSCIRSAAKLTQNTTACNLQPCPSAPQPCTSRRLLAGSRPSPACAALQQPGRSGRSPAWRGSRCSSSSGVLRRGAAWRCTPPPLSTALSGPPPRTPTSPWCVLGSWDRLCAWPAASLLPHAPAQLPPAPVPHTTPARASTRPPLPAACRACAIATSRRTASWPTSSLSSPLPPTASSAWQRVGAPVAAGAGWAARPKHCGSIRIVPGCPPPICPHVMVPGT